MPATSGESSKNTLCRIVGPSHPWALGSGAPDRIIPEKYGFVVSHPRQLHYPGLSAGMFLQDVARHGCRAQAPREGFMAFLWKYTGGYTFLRPDTSYYYSKNYLPTQNLEKISPSKSSVENSPVISLRCCWAFRRSSAINSPAQDC